MKETKSVYSVLREALDIGIKKENDEWKQRVIYKSQFYYLPKFSNRFNIPQTPLEHKIVDLFISEYEKEIGVPKTKSENFILDSYIWAIVASLYIFGVRTYESKERRNKDYAKEKEKILLDKNILPSLESQKIWQTLKEKYINENIDVFKVFYARVITHYKETILSSSWCHWYSGTRRNIDGIDYLFSGEYQDSENAKEIHLNFNIGTQCANFPLIYQISSLLPNK